LNIGNTLKVTTAFLAAAWVSVGVTIQVLFIMIALDYLSGIAAAYQSKTLDSGKARNGAISKAMIIVAVFAVHLIQRLATGTVNIPVDIGSGVAAFFVVNELISVLENCAACGVSLPGFLVTALLKVKQAKATPEEVRQLDSNQ
jgi:toxin secretion/phage lysis holin